MSRPIDDSVTGLRSYNETDPDRARIDILAIHGRGAHPDDTWSSLVKVDPQSEDPPVWVNWLRDEGYLRSALPDARIMRYGYQSRWFGEDRVRTSPGEICSKLLPDLHEKRRADPKRPLIIIAHSYGGLVAIQLLLTASNDTRNIFSQALYDATLAIVFFGTAFRGSGPSGDLANMAKAELGNDVVFDYRRGDSDTEAPALDQSVREFVGKMRYADRPEMLCAYEQRPTNISQIINKELKIRHSLNAGSPSELRRLMPHSRIWIDEASATLDFATRWPRARTHLDLNKFSSPSSEDFTYMILFLKQAIRLRLQTGLYEAASVALASTSRRWSDLGVGQDALLGNASSYWRAITPKSFLIYSAIHEDCSHVNGRTAYDALAAQLPVNILGAKLPRVWQRLAPLSAMLRPGQILAVLYMLHVETVYTNWLPRDEDNIKGRIAQTRKEQIMHWATWATCSCVEECCAQWNFANDTGLWIDEGDKCQVAAWKQGHLRTLPTFWEACYHRLYRAWANTVNP